MIPALHPSICITVIIFAVLFFIYRLVKFDASRKHDKLLNAVFNDPTNDALSQALIDYQWQEHIEKINVSYPHESRAESTRQYIIQCQKSGVFKHLTQQELP
jgi:hypothetical protein